MNTTSKQAGLLASLAIVVTVISIFNFACVHYLRTMKAAVSDPQSFYDLRGPYFGAIDLLNHSDPYIAHPATEALAKERYGVERWPCLYAPIVTSIYFPLTALSFPWAKVAWLNVSVVLLGVSAWLILHAVCGSTSLLAVAFIVLFVTNFEAGLRTLDMGQANVVVLLFLCLSALFSGQRNDDWRSGTTLALAALIKPIPGIIFLWLLLTKQFRALACGIATIVVVTALGIAMFGTPVHLSFLQTLSRSAHNVSSWWCNQSLYGLLNQCLGHRWLNCPDLAQPLWLVSTCILLVVTVITTLKGKNTRAVVNWSLWLVTGLLISTRTWDHYFLWLLIPLCSLLWSFANKQNLRLLLLLCLDYCILSFSVLNLVKIEILHHGPLILVMNLGTMGLLLLYVLLLLAHRQEPQSSSAVSRVFNN